MSFIANARGGIGIPGLYAIYKYREEWPDMIGKQREEQIGILGAKGTRTPLFCRPLGIDSSE